MGAMPDGKGKASSEMNVTPLIDILLVLLIIFMVLPHPSYGERTEIPQKSQHPETELPDDPVVLQLLNREALSRPQVKINQQAVDWDTLEARLREIYDLRVEKVAFVKGDPEVDFEYVAELVDIAHHAGVARVGLMGSRD